VKNRVGRRALGVLAGAWAAIFFVGGSLRVLADCASFGLPFTDLGSTSFCAAIAEAYYTGITHGTSATTFSPTASVDREQAAIFATRTLDAALTRGSRRAALGQWWTTRTTQWNAGFGVTAVGTGPARMTSDGEDVWVTNVGDDTISRVHARDGRLLGTWTGATLPFGILAALGRIFVTGVGGEIFMIDPTLPPGDVTAVVKDIPDQLSSIAFDGSKLLVLGGTTIWSIDPTDWSFVPKAKSDIPSGLVFDGTSLWYTEASGEHLFKLDASFQNILAEVPVTGLGVVGADPLFDGANIWALGPLDDTITVVRASDGVIVKKMSAAGGIPLKRPYLAAFDGRRVAVSNDGFVSIFNSTDLSFQGTLPSPGIGPVCSDGIDFWLGIGPNSIGRF